MEEKQKEIEENEQSLRDLWDDTKQPHMCDYLRMGKGAGNQLEKRRLKPSQVLWETLSHRPKNLGEPEAG